MPALVAVAAAKDEAVTAAQKAATAKKTIAAGEAVDADAVVNVEAAEAVGAAGCGTRWRNSCSHNNCSHNRQAAGIAAIAMAGKQTNSELTALRQTTTVTTTAIRAGREQLQ